MIETKVDEKGRMLLPKEVREELGVKAKGKVVLVKEAAGYAIFPRQYYRHPTEKLEKLAVKGPGNKNPKREIRKWIASRI